MERGESAVFSEQATQQQQQQQQVALLSRLSAGPQGPDSGEKEVGMERENRGPGEEERELEADQSTAIRLGTRRWCDAGGR